MQKRSIAIGAALAGITLFSGCTSSHPSAAWQGRGYDAGSSGNSSALVFTPRNESAGSLIFSNVQGPEYSRRDHHMSSFDTSRRDELFGVRQQRQSSLSRTRSYRSSTRAEEYRYPTQERSRSNGYRRYTRDH
ncbi:MAG: hypothetical protein JKY43_02675 [Phycisphaerales bacterium]|nr:hypothetical protein [Phycisphaerales bacterium]